MHPPAYLFNAFLKEEKFLSDLKKAIITLLFEKGDRTNPENYMPISLTSSLSKMFERLLRDQIVEFLFKEIFIPERNLVLDPKYQQWMPLFIALNIFDI